MITNMDSSCHGRLASSWSDPHQAPPPVKLSNLVAIGN